jgi:hypothetical protein
MKNYWLDKKAAKVAMWDFQTALGENHEPLYVSLEELKLEIIARNPQVLGIQVPSLSGSLQFDDSHVLPPWNTETYNFADLSGWECDL